MEKVKLELTSSEALVLVEFLIRFSKEDKLKIEHPSEERLLWDLCSMLESQVPELLDKNYTELLSEARKAVQTL
ncbi:MAG: hypothetical protein K9G41_00500 [Flavobacteriales bacterium]|nr:hypothetical protein [Flavobacteriales bacterium]